MSFRDGLTTPTYASRLELRQASVDLWVTIVNYLCYLRLVMLFLSLSGLLKPKMCVNLHMFEFGYFSLISHLA